MTTEITRLPVGLFHGPDRIPVAITNSGNVSCEFYQPFHGIISRGLMNRLDQENVSLDLWFENSPSLENCFQGGDKRGHDLRQLVDWAKECGVLSFAQSAQAALRYVEKHLGEQRRDGEDVEYELWNLKEGHISSVWKVSFTIDGYEESFALNVARDFTAGRELQRTSETMERIGAEFPDINMAKVRDIREVNVDYFADTIAVVSVLNDWIEDGYEVHTLTDSMNNVRFVLVERFLIDPKSPAQISKIRGRWLQESEVVTIKNDIEGFLKMAAATGNPVEIISENGDVVWNGEKAFIVAVSE